MFKAGQDSPVSAIKLPSREAFSRINDISHDASTFVNAFEPTKLASLRIMGSESLLIHTEEIGVWLDISLSVSLTDSASEDICDFLVESGLMIGRDPEIEGKNRRRFLGGCTAISYKLSERLKAVNLSNRLPNMSEEEVWLLLEKEMAELLDSYPGSRERLTHTVDIRFRRPGLSKQSVTIQQTLTT